MSYALIKPHEPFRQRIIMSHNLENLRNEEEAKRYIKEKLDGVGCESGSVR